MIKNSSFIYFLLRVFSCNGYWDGASQNGPILGGETPCIYENYQVFLINIRMKIINQTKKIILNKIA